MKFRQYLSIFFVGAVAVGFVSSPRVFAAEYFTDFSEYTTGVAPSDWTKTRDLGTAAWTVEAVTGATGGKVLRGDNASTGYSLFTWDDINADAGRANAEVVIKWRTTTLQDNSTSGSAALVRAQTDFTNGYQAWTRNQATAQLALQKNSGANLGNTNFSWSNNTWYVTRLRANGTSIQVRIWADGDAEPGTWAISATDSGISNGPVGVAISNATGVYEFDYVGVGTAGDTAPTTGSSPNGAPNAPSADSPSNGATGVSITPAFTMTATDDDSDKLQYKATIYSDSGCGSVVQTNSQSSSQTGWSGQDATCSSGSDCYNSGTQGSYQAQTALSYSTTYYWKPSAKDPLGTDTFTDGSTCVSFTTAAAPIGSGNTNISSEATEHWAWNDVIGWIDFYDTDTVNVLSPGIEGYADSSVGWISLDCGTSPSGNVCGSSDYQVLNDGNGNLSGWGWNDSVGWISFCGGLGTENCPGGTSYRVLIDTATGDFSGWAWNDATGWISFNCGDPDVCGTSDYKVRTSWVATSTSGYLDSSTFDTSVSGGAQINSVVWHGSMPSPANGASVSFQFAVSGSPSGPWNYKGPDGTASTYYTTYAPDSPYVVSYVLHNNARYFRYRVTLTSNQTQTFSPRVDSVSVNWSR